MTKVAILSGGTYSSLKGSFDLYIGVDRGALTLLEKDYPLGWAIGDFDSIDDEEFSKIKKSSARIFQSPAEKNDTDTELALKLLFKEYPCADVTIFGAFGGRIDHFLSNIFLPSNPEIASFMQQIRLEDERNVVSYLPQGRHVFIPKSGKKYISFMTDEETNLEILGAKYELTSKNYFKKKIYSSNEYVRQPIQIVLSKGYIIVIESED